MKVIALDLSTSSGVSIFESGKLIDYTVIKHKVKGNNSSEDYPYNYLDMADQIALKVCACILAAKPDYVVIEETNKGKERFRQKQLEFIHSAVARSIRKLDHKVKIRYIDTSAWRNILSISLNSDQREQNKIRQNERDSKREEISRNIYASLEPKMKSEIAGLGKREANKIIKQYDKHILKLVGKEMGKFRSSIKQVDQKNLSVNYVNENFNLSLKKSENDIADSICVGHAFILNNYSAILKR